MKVFAPIVLAAGLVTAQSSMTMTGSRGMQTMSPTMSMGRSAGGGGGNGGATGTRSGAAPTGTPMKAGAEMVVPGLAAVLAAAAFAA